MLPANREFHVVAGVIIFPTHPGLHVNLQRFARVFDLAPDVGFRRSWYRRKACTAYFLQGSGFAGIRAWVCEIWFPRTEATGVFLVRLEDIFPIGIPARPGKILAIREFHVVHGCVFFPTCPGLADQLVASQEDSARKRGNALHRGELGFARYDLANGGRWNVPYAKGFDHNSLVSRPFLARKVLNRSSHRALQNGQGSGQFDSAFGLVNGPVKPWSNLVLREILPQFACHSLSDALALNRLTHGSKVKVGFRFLVFSQNSIFPTSAFSSSSDLALRKSVRPSEFGNPESKHVEDDLAWVTTQISNRVIQQSGDPESKHVGVNLAWVTTQVSNRLGNLESKHVGDNLGFDTCQIANWMIQRSGNPKSKHVRINLAWVTTQVSNRVIQRSGDPESKHVRDNLGFDTCQIANWMIQRSGNPKCLTEVVVAGIIAGPHALDSCECMNIEGQDLKKDLRCHASSIEVVVALSVGSKCTRIPYFRLSYLIAHLVGLSDALDHLVGRHFLNLRSVRLNLRLFQLIPDGGSIFLDLWSVTRFPQFGSHFFLRNLSRMAIQNSLFPGFDTITDLGDSARGVHSPG
uniref:Uncharacterized protein n=1 Tax=Fagus sylvatica TaxID=28930 RepID=A0A2N9I1T2_FAGSY